MNNSLIHIENAIPRLIDIQFKSLINWQLNKNENWVVIGPNGAGKTIFANILTGKIPLKSGKVTYRLKSDKPVYEQIKFASFVSIYNQTNYYQQRWHSTENEDALIRLSSGELRKYQIGKLLSSDTEILLLDNPYIGLDAGSRDFLNELLTKLIEEKNLQLILIVSDPKDIPGFVSHVQPIFQKELLPALSKEDFLRNRELIDFLFPKTIISGEIMNRSAVSDINYENTLKLDHILVRYKEKIILENLSWIVKKGEHWALLGPNGSGKSTLLSLIYADNPQSYANTFYLFDKKRGSGESIWDIKKRIGYVSPEFHLYLNTSQRAIDIVGSGFFDSVGLFRKCSEIHLQEAGRWMEIFGIASLAERSFSKLSFGEQRLVILIRAFVKDPELLILDEPLHGLDRSYKRKVLDIIESFCRNPGKTLIYVTHYEDEIPVSVTKRLVLAKMAI